MVKVFIFNGSLNRNSTTDYLIKNFLNKKSYLYIKHM